MKKGPLVDIGNCAIQLCGDYIVNHEIRIPIETAGILSFSERLGLLGALIWE